MVHVPPCGSAERETSQYVEVGKREVGEDPVNENIVERISDELGLSSTRGIEGRP